VTRSSSGSMRSTVCAIVVEGFAIGWVGRCDASTGPRACRGRLEWRAAPGAWAERKRKSCTLGGPPNDGLGGVTFCRACAGSHS
jgi:hypothetical protein